MWLPNDALERMLEGTQLISEQDLESGAFAVTRSKEPVAGKTKQRPEPRSLGTEQDPENSTAMNETNKTIGNLFKGLITLAFAGSPSSVTAQSDDQNIIELDAVVVDGLRQQLAVAAQAEREKKTVFSILTADDVGNFPDQTLAESLSRLPGVSVDDEEGEGRYVHVRGMPRDFAQVTVNGAQLGSSDSGGDRSVALDVVPGDLFQQVELGKTLLFDTDADSFGAYVDLRPLSAFSRPAALISRVSLRGNYGELAGEWDPNLRANVSNQWKTAGGRVGLAGAISYSERTVHGDVLRSDSGGGIRYANAADDPEGAPEVLYIRELDQRMERGSRERIGGTVVFDFDNDSDFSLQLSGIYGELHDDDVRVQQEVELRDASESETILLESGHGIFTDVDLERQIAFFGPTEETYALHLETEKTFGSNAEWTLSTGVDYSENHTSMPTAANRGRWLERDQIVEAWWDKSSATYQVLGKGDYDNRDELDFDFRPGPEDFVFGQLGTIQEDRTDDILSYNVDLLRKLEMGERTWEIKGGLKQRSRDRNFVRGELFSSDVDAEVVEPLGYPGTLETVPTFVPDTAFDVNGGIPGGAVWPEIEWARSFLEDIRQTLDFQPTDVRRDFGAGEDTDAAYLMTSVDLSPRLEMIVGARYEKTDYTAIGLTENEIEIEILDPDNPGETTSQTLVSSADVQTYNHSYDNVLPGIFFVWDATEEVVARLSYSKGQVRPSFGQANGLINNEWDFTTRAAAELDGYSGPFTNVTLNGVNYEVAADPDTYQIQTEGGNPFLNPIIADQFDFNLGWYPNSHSNLTIAFYKKDMTDFIVGVDTGDPDVITALGGNAIDPLTGLATTDYDKSINVSNADLSGMEISGRYGFVNAPGFLSDVHVSGNAAWLSGSTSTPFIDNGAEFDLPGLTDFIGNIAVAYETRKFSLQLSARYRTERVRSRDSDEPWKDIFDEADFRLGANVRYRFNDRLRVFANVQNLTNENSIRYHVGDEVYGSLIKRRADFGRTYQFGADLSF